MVKKSNLILFVYAISSIFAGCSNENTSLVVVLISVAYFFIMNRNKYLLIGVFGSAIGAGGSPAGSGKPIPCVYNTRLVQSTTCMEGS